MIATSHFIIGGSVGVVVGTIIGTTSNPAIIPACALAAGIVSHLVCDAIPHIDHPPDSVKIGDDIVWTRKVFIFAYTDSILGGLLALLIWGGHFHFNLLSPFIWGAAGGYLPDFMDNVPYWNNIIRKIPGFQYFHRLHVWVHKNWEPHFPMPKYSILGIATQLVIAIPALLYILK